MESPVIATLIFLVVCSNLAASSIPDYIPVCKRNDPNIDNCITKSIEKLRPHLKRGIPEVNVPGLEPLKLPEIQLVGGRTIKAIGKNIDVGGASNFIVKRLKVNDNGSDIVVDLSVDLPFLTFDGQYEVSGTLLLLPLKGKGPIHANATDCKADVVLRAREAKRKDGLYLHFHSMDIDLTIGGYHVKLENLFNGDKFLGEATNTALNQNQKELITYITPIIEKTVGELILSIANNITHHFMLSELLPDS